METYINSNAIMDAVGFVIIIVILTGSLKIPNENAQYKKSFNFMVCFTASALIFDVLAWLLDGGNFVGIRALLLICNSLYYLSQIFFCYFWLIFSLHWNQCVKQNTLRFKLLMSLPLIIEVILIFANIFNGRLFYFTYSNTYVRSDWYMFNLMPYIIYICGALAVSVKSVIKPKNDFSKRQSSMLIVFMGLPIFGTVASSFYYGLSFLWTCVALMLLMIYMYTQQEFAMEQMLKVTKEKHQALQLKLMLNESKTRIMLSQIQPHFLYNALGAIQQLCYDDPISAQKAIDDFSHFLRGNMDSLNTDSPILFNSELEHVKYYLSLEKMRFSDRLNVNYDIKCTDFTLPTLTLQPLVENAVRHGITKKENGGSVNITTYEEESGYNIIIEDDGVGFVVEDINEDDTLHVGLSNVKKRLEIICASELIITSQPQKGTRVQIIIPKEKKDK